jgi:kynurenine formamidase
MNTRLEMADHTGTHIDSLNHVSIGERVYNGVIAEEIVGTFGSTKLGIEKTPPIFTKGILMDVAMSKGVQVLDPGYAISAKDLKDSLRTKNLELEKGDAVLVHTGWAKHWMTDNKKFLGPVPGIDLSAAEWLADQGAAVVGADTWNVEVDPSEDLRGADAVHQHLLTKNGIRLIENLSLEELSRDCVSEFLFVCLPLRLKGGSGSPITPIAVT